MTVETERYYQSWLQAQSTLLSEWRNLTDKQRRKVPDELGSLLDQLGEEWNDYRDHVTLRAEQIVAEHEALIASHVVCVRVLTDDGGYEWISVPEATHSTASVGTFDLFRSPALGANGPRMLLRSWPLASIDEVRTVPRDHPWLENTTEWTTTGQGYPLWTAEDEAIVEEEGIGIVAEGAEQPEEYGALRQELRDFARHRADD